ncbi:cell division protein PerM [Streptomyces rubiginosohelvolus]|uniref:cell division protein PerM n=1 Tax=Streptomyces rubiginosohelvolus TaxID=67362 RepID=UPI0033A69A5E
MTQRTPKVTVRRNRTLALVSALVKGVLAAGLGLGSLTVLVMVVWISSPYPDSGPGGALRAAAGVWLLAHGAGLVRPDTLSGVPAPVGMVPLLLAMGPVWLAHRAARDAAEPQEELDEGARDGATGPSRAGAFCAVTAGYLLVVAGAAAYARGGPLYADPDTLAFPVALVVAGAAAVGVWTAAGRPFGPAPSWSPLAVQEAVARTLFRRRAEAAFRSAAAGLTMLLGGGALLVAVALGRNAGAAQDAFLGLAGDWSGRIAVLLLAAALVPNAALWGAAYGLGPGFSLGTGATATPLALDGTPALPRFPLLAAVPDQGAGALPNWAALAVPVAAALAVAWFAVRRAAPADAPRARAWSPRETVLVTLLAALGCGAGTALLTAVAGGPIGTGALSEFGPVWWLTGPAALVWTAVIGVPAALLMRLWRLRTPGWAWRRDVPEADGLPVAEADAEEEEEGEDEGDHAGRPRRWWAPWRGRRAGGEGGQAGPGAPASPAASSVPSPGPAPEAASGFEPYDFLPTDPWHEKGGPWHGKETREARWASLKQGSGGLMADFPAERTADHAGRTDRADRADPVPDRRATDPDGPGATP